MSRVVHHAGWFKRWAQYSPSATAMECGETGKSFSYNEANQRIRQCALLLSKEYSISSGDRVAVLAQNQLDYLILFFALQELGAILVPLNFRLTYSELHHIISDCEPRLILFDGEFELTAKRLLENISITGDLLSNLSLRLDRYAIATDELRAETNTQEDLPCLILYTSGTTGHPKGALLTNSAIHWNSINTHLRLNITQADRAVIFLPLFHTGGWNVLTTPFFHHGAHIILLKKFESQRILELIETKRTTILFGVPTTMDLLASDPSFTSRDLSSLRFAVVGGEPMKERSIEVWHKRNVPIRQGYGLTEFGPNVFSLEAEHAVTKMGSIGFPNFYIDAKIVGDIGQTLGADQIGELALKGPVAMREYWRHPEATQEILKDGWLYTGDLVRRDEDGFYYVVGRKKDMFISGGENVYPAEVEKTLLELEEVIEAAVIGVHDEKWGEVGMAFVASPSTDRQSLKEKILKHCATHLAKFKIPRYIEFLDALPKGQSGKILKRELKFENRSNID